MLWTHQDSCIARLNMGTDLFTYNGQNYADVI